MIISCFYGVILGLPWAITARYCLLALLPREARGEVFSSSRALGFVFVCVCVSRASVYVLPEEWRDFFLFIISSAALQRHAVSLFIYFINQFRSFPYLIWHYVVILAVPPLTCFDYCSPLCVLLCVCVQLPSMSEAYRELTIDGISNRCRGLVPNTRT